MSISPPSDIVLDVLRASDPARLHSATQKLARTAAESKDTARINIRPTAATPTRPSFDADYAMTRRHNLSTLSQAHQIPPSSQIGSAHRQFETMVLKDFVERMLPDKSEQTYGQGTAGNVWKSWMADAVATEISKSGSIGIAKALQPTSPVTPVPRLELKTPTSPQRTNDKVAMPEKFGPLSGLSGFVSKLQEMFLDAFVNNLDGGASTNSRPKYDV